ncbi:MAG: hypothetical protein ACYC96_09565 [Fimbriimonadaceae bacterium]
MVIHRAVPFVFAAAILGCNGTYGAQGAPGSPMAKLDWYSTGSSPFIGRATNLSTDPETIVVRAVWKDAGRDRETSATAYTTVDSGAGVGDTVPPGKQGVIALAVPNFPIDRIEMRVTGASGATQVIPVNPP